MVLQQTETKSNKGMDTYRMGENTSQLLIQQRINIQDL